MSTKRTRADRGIYWRSWGLVQGCTAKSEGCLHCWSRELHNRFAMPRGEPPFSEVRFQGDRLDIPWHRKVRTWYAVWNDLFHDEVSVEDIAWALAKACRAEWHTFIILTKRIEVAAGLSGSVWFRNLVRVKLPLALSRWPPRNIIIGTTVENQKRADERMPHLARLAALGWRTMVSAEPLLEWTTLNIARYGPLTWLVIGAESGARRRWCDGGWVRSLIDEADAAGTPVWVKQLDISGRVSNDPAEWPQWARRRERPEVTHG